MGRAIAFYWEFMDFVKIAYEDLNSRQKENFNFAKLAAVLAEYGYTALRLSDDWEGADLIAVHIDGTGYRRVQLKGRLTFNKKYLGKSLWIAFRADGWYVYPHDALFERFKERIENTEAWKVQGGYSWPGIPEWASELLTEYRI